MHKPSCLLRIFALPWLVRCINIWRWHLGFKQCVTQGLNDLELFAMIIWDVGAACAAVFNRTKVYSMLLRSCFSFEVSLVWHCNRFQKKNEGDKRVWAPNPEWRVAVLSRVAVPPCCIPAELTLAGTISRNEMLLYLETSNYSTFLLARQQPY
jgi:hypothetical protein